MTKLTIFLFILSSWSSLSLPMRVPANDSIKDTLKEKIEGRSNYLKSKPERAPKSLVSYEKSHGSLGELLLEEIVLAININVSLEKVIGSFLSKVDMDLGANALKQRLVTYATNQLRSQRRIDDILYRLILSECGRLFEEKLPGPTTRGRRTPKVSSHRKVFPGSKILDLGTYFKKKKSLETSRDQILNGENLDVDGENLDVDGENIFPVGKYGHDVNDHRKLSIRESLYYRYSSFEIKKMAEIIDLVLKLSDANKFFSTFEFSDGSGPYVLEHSPTEQYRAALRIMNIEKMKLESSILRGRKIKQIDLLASAYELGIISYHEISYLVHDENFYKPKEKFLKKVLRYFGKIGKMGLMVHPTTAPFAIIPIILMNSYNGAKSQVEKIDERAFMFEVPR